MQAAGGALIGGLGGGSVFTAVGGALGAGLTSKAAQGLNDIAAGVESETGSALLGNLTGNVVAGLGGALVGGTAGAATASNVQLYNQQLDPLMKKKSLVPSSCTATGPCNEAVMTAQMNATGANAQAASQNMATGALYGVPAAAVMALGPEAVVAAITAGGYDLAGSAYSYVTGQSKDAPSFTSSYIAGIVGAVVNGVGAFGTSSMQRSNPEVGAGVAVATTSAGSWAKAVLPSPIGNMVNQIMQGSAGPIQTAIQNSQSKK